MKTELIRDVLDKLEVVNREAVKEPNPRSSPKPPGALERLLEGVNDDNIHQEWETGPAVGREVW